MYYKCIIWSRDVTQQQSCNVAATLIFEYAYGVSLHQRVALRILWTATFTSPLPPPSFTFIKNIPARSEQYKPIPRDIPPKMRSTPNGTLVLDLVSLFLLSLTPNHHLFPFLSTHTHYIERYTHTLFWERHTHTLYWERHTRTLYWERDTCAYYTEERTRTHTHK